MYRTEVKYSPESTKMSPTMKPRDAASENIGRSSISRVRLRPPLMISPDSAISMIVTANSVMLKG